MRKIKVISLLVMLAVTMLNAGIGSAQATKKPVKLGFVADISGIGYVFSQSQEAGLELAITDINAAGGILGNPIAAPEIRDAQLTASIGADEARQMILQDKVDFLLGGTSSGVAAALEQVAKENHVVIALHTSNAASLTTTGGNPYVVQVVPNTTIEARAVAKYVTSQADLAKVSKWASIGPDYSFGHDSYNAFQPQLVKLNANASVINNQWPKLGETDLTPFITALQGAKPDAIFSNLWGDELATFLQQAQPLGVLDNTPFIGLFDVDVLKEIGTDLPTGKAIYGYTRAPFYAYNSDTMTKFVAKYRKLTNGQWPSDWAITMYDAVWTLKAAAEKAGSTDGDAVAKALDDLSVDSLRGPITIRACDHMANVGEWVGKLSSSVDSKYGIATLTDLQYVKAEDTWDSCDAIAAMRQTAAANATATAAAKAAATPAATK